MLLSLSPLTPTLGGNFPHRYTEMTVFISYNHKDNEFAERIALELVRQNVKVWKDSWRIGVGDSLIQKVQDGLEGARFFCVIFSENSLQSQWVKREITAALLREIESRKVMLLPIVIDDCKLPLLVRDKLYADFRAEFEVGMQKLLAVILPYYQTQNSGRVSQDDHYYIDYSCFSELVEDRIVCEIDIVSFDLEEPYSILTQFRFEGSEAVSLETLGINSISEVTDLIIATCADEFSQEPGRVVLSPGKKYVAHFSLHDKDGMLLFDAHLIAKIVGDKHRGTVLFNAGALFSQINSSRHLNDD